MIGMGMGADGEIEAGDPERTEVAHHGGITSARVDENGLTAATDQDRVALAHIEEVDHHFAGKRGPSDQ